MNFLEELRALDINEPGRWPIAFRLGAVGIVLVIVAALGIWQFVVKQEDTRPRGRAERRGGAPRELPVQAAQGGEFRRFPQSARDHRARFRHDARPAARQGRGRSSRRRHLADGARGGTRRAVVREGERSQPRLLRRAADQLRYLGSYHELGRFVSDVAALSRIVTLHDIRITPNSVEGEEESCSSTSPPRPIATSARTRSKTMSNLSKTESFPPTRVSRPAAGPFRLRLRRARAAGLYRRHQGTAGRADRAAARGASAAELRLRGGRPPLAFRAHRA